MGGFTDGGFGTRGGGLPTNVSVAGTLDVAGSTTLGDAAGDTLLAVGSTSKFGAVGSAYFMGEQLNFQFGNAGNAEGYINRVGYAGSTGHFRDLYIQDGKAGTIITCTGSTKAVTLAGPLDHDGASVGFYGTAPVAKQTGVAVTAGAIHAALVALGLIAA